MADRIIAALEYLDAHTALVLQKSKHRSLGDIDAKYDVIDPTEFPLHPSIKNDILLSGTNRNNLSRDKTYDQILDEDREKILQSSYRTKSASSRKTNLQSRPQTSLSSMSGLMTSDNRRRNYRPTSQAASSISSRTSLKKLSFTPPGVDVGPTDARDEVMEEIASKPLTRNHLHVKSRSAPARTRTRSSMRTFGQQTRVSIGCRSMTSMKRSKTFHVDSKRSESPRDKFETKPGPFATVKVAGSDMWVVSDSTPSSYFNGDLSASAQNGLGKKKTPNWEETADSVPREERSSPPRHQRQLGAPPQFGASQQWYTFSGSDPSKQRPILTAFAAEQPSSEYYNIESRVSQKVLTQLQSSPGMRIGINGHVVSKSMKVSKKTPNKILSEDGFSLPEEEDEQKENQEVENPKNEEITSKSPERRGSEKSNDELSTENEDAESPRSNTDIFTQEEEDKQFSLLRYIGVAKGENPYVTNTSSDATSTSGDVVSMFNTICKNDKNSVAISNDPNDEAVWKLLEGTSPHLWMDKRRWREMREEMVKRRAKQIALHGHDDQGPLSWKDQLEHMEGKVIETRVKADKTDNKVKSGSSPVVFHKLLDYEKLPIGFLHLTGNGYRSHSSVSKVDGDLNLSPPSKGFASTMPISPRTIRSAHANGTTHGSYGVTFPPRPFTSQSHTNRGENLKRETHNGLNLSDVIHSGSDAESPANKAVSNTYKHIDKSRIDDVSEEELEALRQEAACNMKMMGVEENGMRNREDQSNRKNHLHDEEAQDKASNRRKPDRTVTLSSLPVKTDAAIATVDIRPSVPSSSMPVGSLNLADFDNILNGQNPTSEAQIRVTVGSASSRTPPNSVINGVRNGTAAPVNTPKSPPTRHLSQIKGTPRMDSHPDASRSGSKSASMASKSPGVTPRGNVLYLSSGPTLPRQMSSRASSGFMASPLIGRPSVNKHVSANRLGISRTTSEAIKSIKSNTGILQTNANNSQSDSSTKAGFIQISHSLHIPSQKLPSASGGGSGNKIYDSYMRELSSREAAANGGGVVVGKSLGGTSGKILPDHVAKTHQSGSMSSANMSRMKGNYPNFSTHPARRSGLAITTDVARGIGQHPISNSGNLSASLELQGDPVRLNLDKNIHVIYRDLGIPKRTSRNSLPGSPLPSKASFFDGRESDRSDVYLDRRSNGSKSHPHSAKSRENASNHSMGRDENLHVVNIPTAPPTPDLETERAVFQLHEIPTLEELDKSVMTVDGNIPSSDAEQCSQPHKLNKTASVVVDSGTQWSPHEVNHRLTGVSRLLSDAERKDALDTLPDSPVNREKNDVERVALLEENSEELVPKIDEEVNSTEISGNHSSNIDGDVCKENNQLVSEPPPSADPLVVGGNEKNDQVEDVAPSGIEADEDVDTRMIPAQRSMSEGHLDQVGAEKEPEETALDEDLDMRGVTKVTVNIPPPVPKT